MVKNHIIKPTLLFFRPIINDHVIIDFIQWLPTYFLFFTISVISDPYFLKVPNRRIFDGKRVGLVPEMNFSIITNFSCRNCRHRNNLKLLSRLVKITCKSKFLVFYQAGSLPASKNKFVHNCLPHKNCKIKWFNVFISVKTLSEINDISF